MLYLSAPFFYLLFCALVFYYVVPQKFKNLVLLLASLYFVSFYNIKNLYYLLVIILTVYGAGRLIEKQPAKAKFVLLSSIIFFASLFYYTKFFTYGLQIFSNLGLLRSLQDFSIFVPLGISFYMLQGLSYLIDVYRGKEKAEKSILLIALFLSYFPTIVQGPIMRFHDIREKFLLKKVLDYDSFSEGVLLIFWGAFKKLVIANRLAIFVDLVFNDYTSYYGLVVLIAAIFYSIQIYTDFSGAVDICKGISKLFGIDLMDNFRQPYFSRSIKDFWGRWHISLSSWLRDYIYFPLGGNRKGLHRQMLNILIVFTVSGIWHGVGLQFLVWGWLHAFYQIIPMLFKPSDNNKLIRYYRKAKFLPIVLNFLLVTFTWIIFRSNGTKAGLMMIASVFTKPYGFTLLRAANPYHIFEILVIVVSLIILFVVECLELKSKNNICKYFKEKHLPLRWAAFMFIIIAVFVFGIYGDGYDASQFIYMQF